jgi:hypothetical protein
MQPQRRTEGLLVEELPEETVVYDRRHHEVHCLSRAAALVWNHCDGRTSPVQLAESLHQELTLPADLALVRLILEQLKALDLLVEQSPGDARAARRRRREVVKLLAHYGLGMMVLTIAAPTMAQAASCGAKNQACCQPGNTCNAGCNCDMSMRKCTGGC